MQDNLRAILYSQPDIVSTKTATTVFYSPLIIMLLTALLIFIPATRNFVFSIIGGENGPVELLTFIFLMVGGVFGLKLAISRSVVREKYVSFFYVVFSFFLILVAMEEIAWGQWFFHFETPEEWKKINMQGETTLHNLEGWKYNQILRFIFGMG